MTRISFNGIVINILTTGEKYAEQTNKQTSRFYPHRNYRRPHHFGNPGRSCHPQIHEHTKRVTYSEYWVAVVKPGRIMFEIDGVTEAQAKEAIRLASHKLPLKCKFVAKGQEIVKGGEA